MTNLHTQALERSPSKVVVWLPLLATLGYPFLLMLFHTQINQGNGPAAVLLLLVASAVPLLGMLVASRPGLPLGLRRLAYACVVAPTLYVFLGVVQALLGSSLPDPLVWCVLWSLAALLAARRGRVLETERQLRPGLGRWRVAHGISALVLCLYVLFHLGNHLTGLVGPALHAEVMDAGRTVYRAWFIEPLLVLAFVFQAVSGLYLAWHWSAKRQDLLRTFQIATGVYLAVFVLGHMNSVFIYARTYLGIPTDWNFATGAPTGLLLDPWNIRLVPHYTLGVFFVLGHLLAGLRVVLEAHGVAPGRVRGLWYGGMFASALVALAIIAGMLGLRL
ncbi:hypothetical protein ACQKPE_18580 [Pseudomonas sp. NPDC089554]|uniref:hypothetical protein n=1 Tax=Pseudomonas sp. NPDC089554 TaxID=3390653 RepID=UPI003D049510